MRIDSITLHTLDVAQAGHRLMQLAARARTGHPTLLTRRGEPYAGIVSADMLVGQTRPKASFLALRGSGKGLWGPSPVGAVADLRDEWA